MSTAILMVLAALIIGFSKTSLGGLAVLSVAIFADILPAKESTAAILVLLIVGDVIACWHYRHDGDWALIRRLMPAVLVGIALGTAFLRIVDDTFLKRSISVVILVLVALQLWLKARPTQGDSRAHEHPIAAWSAGAGAGFTTMTANAAGAVMTLYLSASGVDKKRFVGTMAWFFLIVNLSKVPFSLGLGLLHWRDLSRAAMLAPAILVGAWVGYATIKRISQGVFDIAILLASAVAAIGLLIRS
ncbi:sulfite exporter TauE/SafE family protein [Nostocoides jenkinsii]|nr:sulfite exporter TauE/SafE family protein [Tetrasphaera jenkinsii]